METNNTLVKSTQNLTLTQRLKLRDRMPCLILDISGSMCKAVDENIEPDVSKINKLKEILKSINPLPRFMYTFSSDSNRVSPSDIQDIKPNGSTVLSNALSLAIQDNQNHCILITDGEVDPYDRDKSLELCKNLIIDIIYIGPDSKVPDFLTLLVKNCKQGSFASKADLASPNLLTEKIQLLLTQGDQYK